MRKTTTKKVSLTSKVKKPTTVTGTRVAKPILTGQEQINKAIAAMETDDKELELLKRELEKPMKQRNQALMAKHGILDGSKLTDNYPDLNKGVNYELAIHFPEDDGIRPEDRPKLWYVGLSIEWGGNKFNFRFPIHSSTYLDGQSLFKLDGFAVYVNHDGVIKNDISEYTIFQALTDYHAGTMRDGLVNDVFYKYKIISEDDVDADILNPAVEKNFSIRGHGLYVTSKVIKGTTAATKTTVVSGNQLLQDISPVEHPTGDADLYKAELALLSGGVVVPGLTVKLEPETITLVGVSGGKSTTTSTPRYVFIHYDPAYPRELSCYIAIGPAEGLKKAKEINPGTTKVELVRMIQEHNKSQYNQLVGDVEAEKARIAAEEARRAEEKKVAAEKAAEDLRKKREQEKQQRAEAAKAKKLKEEEDARIAAEKKAAEEEAAAEAAKAAALEERKAWQREQAEIAKLLKGYEQLVVYKNGAKTAFYIPAGSQNSQEEKAYCRDLVAKRKAQLGDDKLVIPGITKALKRWYGNVIVQIYCHPDDEIEDPVLALIELDPSEGKLALKTTILCGYASLAANLDMVGDTPKETVIELISLNQEALAKVESSHKK